MGLEDRIRRLESARSARARVASGASAGDYEMLFNLVENVRAEFAGEPPPHDVPPNRTDPKTIAWLRNSGGWESAAARELLASWERDT